MLEIIDAHHHLWAYQPREFGWISADMQQLARDFLTTELETECRNAGVDGTVAVQARQSLEETHWLLSLAKDSELIRGVVGWAPICSDDFGREFEGLRQQKKLRGLRHVIQDEPDDEFILRDDFNRGISEIAGSGIVYDILIFARHLPAATEFVDRHPDQVFVLDHLAKPAIGKAILDPWRAQIGKLAERPNVYCKLSGMVTEADWSRWCLQDLQTYVDVALEAFGPSRLMAGSDWPVCLLAASYSGWFAALRKLLLPLSESESAGIFGGVASQVYGLAAGKAGVAQ